MRSATGSRVSTKTDRSPSGARANQTSPRCIEPVAPVFGWSPISYRRERQLFPGVQNYLDRRVRYMNDLRRLD